MCIRDRYTSVVYATALSLLPPVIAIGLALFTKEVYTSLLAGILAGALLYANGNLELMLNTMPVSYTHLPFLTEVVFSQL